MKIWNEIWQCRKALAVDHKVLQEPQLKRNFLSTTLGKYHRARLETLNKTHENDLKRCISNLSGPTVRVH